MYRAFYAEYLKLIGEPSSEGFISVACPFHEDHNPSAGISVNTGYLNCHKCGAFSAVQFLEKHTHVSHQEAVELVEDYRLRNNLIEKFDTFVYRKPKFSKKWDELVKLAQASLTEDSPIVYEYMEARQLSFSTLKELGVGLLTAHKTHWKRESLVFPYHINGRVAGIRYRDINGNKGGEPDCHFMMWGIEQLEVEQSVVIVVEGETDRITTYEALQGKYPVVSTPTASFRREWAREFELVQQVIMLPHADDATPKMVQAAQDALGTKLIVVHLPWHRREFGKDVNDWIKLRSHEDFQALIEAHITPGYKQLMTGAEMEEYAEVQEQWLIQGLLSKRQAWIIGGQAKTYKTWFVLNVVKCLLTPGSALCGIPKLESNDQVRNILIVEEEGPLSELNKRARKVLSGTDWRERLFIMHHLGVKLDNNEWGARLAKIIEEKQIDILIFDPLQRLHSGDENDATAMGVVWNAIDRLLARFTELSIIILHHFKKVGDAAGDWGALRGSSRLAGEADLGSFISLRGSSEPRGIKIKFDGRAIEALEDDNGKDYFKLTFNDGLLTYDSGKVSVNKKEALREELEQRGIWGLKEAAIAFGVSIDTMRAWCKSLNLGMTLPSPGNAVQIFLPE